MSSPSLFFLTFHQPLALITFIALHVERSRLWSWQGWVWIPLCVTLHEFLSGWFPHLYSVHTCEHLWELREMCSVRIPSLPFPFWLGFWHFALSIFEVGSITMSILQMRKLRSIMPEGVELEFYHWFVGLYSSNPESLCQIASILRIVGN